MLLNVTAEIIVEKSKKTIFFNLNLEKLDIDTIKKSILERLKIDDNKYTFLMDGILPEKDIKRNIKYWVELVDKNNN